MMDAKVLDRYVKAQRELHEAQAAVEGDVTRADVLYTLTGGEMGERRPADPWLDERTKTTGTAMFAAIVFSVIMITALWSVGFEGAPKGLASYDVPASESVRVNVDRRRGRRGGVK